MRTRAVRICVHRKQSYHTLCQDTLNLPLLQMDAGRNSKGELVHLPHDVVVHIKVALIGTLKHEFRHESVENVHNRIFAFLVHKVEHEYGLDAG